MSCRDQPGFTNHRPGAGGAKAGCIEIRPGLLRTDRACGPDIEPIGLGERNGRAGGNLRRETRKNGEGGCDERRDRNCGKSFDHDGPL